MRQRLILGLVLAWTAAGGSAWARFVRPWPGAQLSGFSDLIVFARPITNKDLNETNSLGFGQPNAPWPGFRGVETTFKVREVLKGKLRGDRVIVHHYRAEWGCPPNGPVFVQFTPGATNEYLLYLVKDATNRYAPTSG
jgi:hypothetical protein